MSNFKDKVVFISGSSQGIGKAVAMELGLLGAKLVLNGRNEKKLESAAEELKTAGVELITIPGDVSSYNECKRMMDEVIEHYGKLDWLINNGRNVGRRQT